MFRKVFSHRLIKFGAVGCIVTLFFMGLNALLHRLLGLSQDGAFLAAYPPALALHFFLNKLWTFGDGRAVSSRHLAEYLYSVLVTFLIQWPAFLVLHEGLKLPGWLAAGGANVVQMAASYAMLRWRVFGRVEHGAEESAVDSWHRLILFLCTLATSALIAWTALGEWKWPQFNKTEGDGYNLLVQGFRKGSLALDVAVPEELKKAPDPWDPAKRPHVPYLHDISFYRGHYYLYFGVVPALVLFWPFKVLTGYAFPFVLAPVAFLVGANLITAWLWLQILRDRFPRAGLLTKLGGVVGLGLCGGQLVLARRPSLWEMPISGGYFFITLMLAAAYLSLNRARSKLWLAVVGLGLGLAVGCRPTLVTGGAALAFLVLVLGRREGASGWLRVRRTGAAALAAGIPLAVIVGALFAYNYARFGNPFEFGIKYQLNSGNEITAKHFRLSYAPFNFRVYFLSRPALGRYFPFVHPPDFGPQPSGYYGTEYVYGALIMCPVMLWLSFSWLPFLRRGLAGVAPFVAYVAFLAVPVTAVLLCFDTAAARYTVDFMPLWVWLGFLGWASLEDALVGWRLPVARLVLAGSLVASAVIAFILSLALHEVLIFRNRQAYINLARIFNWPIALYEGMRGDRFGELQMDVKFPAKPETYIEPLAVTGAGYESDYFFAIYGPNHTVQLGFEDSGESMLLSRSFPYDPNRTYRIGLMSGSVLPPEGHPVFRHWDNYETSMLLSRVRIDVDGKSIINQQRQAHEGAPELLQVGRDQHSGAFGRRFSGSISNVHREPLKSFMLPETHGDIVLDLSLPTEVVDAPEPLVVVGRTGQAELIGCKLLDQNHFAIAYEYWGAGLWLGPPLEVPADRDVKLRIRMGALLRANPANPYFGRYKDDLIVWMNGKVIWWRKSVGPLDPDPKIQILANMIGSSGMRKSFQGALYEETRLPAPTWRPGPFRSVEMFLAGRGTGTQPLTTTGVRGSADTLAMEWQPQGKVRLVYDHWGYPLFRSAPFDWSSEVMHKLVVELPAFQRFDRPDPGDGEGRLKVDLDGVTVADHQVRYYDALSSTFTFGANTVGSSVAGQTLDLELGDIRQED